MSGRDASAATGVFGYSAIDNTLGQAGTAFHRSYYAAANLLWNPAGSLNVGVEYLFGTHQLEAGPRRMSAGCSSPLSSRFSSAGVRWSPDST